MMHRYASDGGAPEPMVRRAKSRYGLLGVTSQTGGSRNQREAQSLALRMVTASVIRVAGRDGLQSLYADTDDFLERFKDSPVIKAMADRKGAKLLWGMARAIDADVCNANGDYFSKADLLANVTVDGKKMPAYKTFEGVPVYTNHKNDDIEQAKGMVVHAEWSEEDNCVYTVFFIDEEAYPDIARGVRQGYMHDVSMGCAVESGTCSKCGHEAQFERDYCDCLKNYKGKRDPKTNEKIYEKNHGIKFIELSVVGDGAFDACMIKEIYDVDDILARAIEETQKKADGVLSLVRYAHTIRQNKLDEQQAWDNAMRQVVSAHTEIMRLAEAAGPHVGDRVLTAEQAQEFAQRLAQTAGTLVGGQLLAAEGANSNATVAGILKFLGLDERAGLNVLDLMNLSLNFLEVAVLNLFARKDNIDLAHVSKISKSMADLQSTMQDMIDDGVESLGGGGGGGGGRQPLNAGQLQQQGGGAAPQQGGAQQQQQAQMGGQSQDYAPAGEGIGRMMGGGAPGMAAVPNAFPILPMGPLGGDGPVGGGVLTASSKKRRVARAIWAGSEGEEEDSRLVVASSGATNGGLTDGLRQETEQRFAHRLNTTPSPFSANAALRVCQTLATLAGAISESPEGRKALAESSLGGRRLSNSIAGGTTHSATTYQSTYSTKEIAPQQAAPHAKSDRTARASGGNMNDSNIVKRLAKRLRENYSEAPAEIAFDGSIKSGEHQLVFSTDGRVKAMFRGAQVNYTPHFTDEQLDIIDSGDFQTFASEALASFKRDVTASNAGKLSRYASNNGLSSDYGYGAKPNMEHETPIGSQVMDKARNIKPEITERRLDNAGDYSRSGEGSNREDALEEKRTGAPEVGTHSRLDDEAGLYSRKNGDGSNNKIDVQEHLIADARRGHPEEIIEEQLDGCRGKWGDSDEKLVMSATIGALGTAVLASGAHPDEVVATAARFASRRDLPELIELAHLGDKHRRSVSKRLAFHRGSAPLMSVEGAFFDALGSAVTDVITAADLSDAVKIVAAQSEEAALSIARNVKARRADAESFEPSKPVVQASREERLKRALLVANQKSERVVISGDHMQCALAALAMAADEASAQPSEVVDIVASANEDLLLSEVELARTSEASEAREAYRARLAFWHNKGRVIRKASRSDVFETAVGALADYAEHNGLSSREIVEAARRVAAEREGASRVLASIIERAHQRKASVQVTEEESKTYRITCRAQEDLGLDPKDPNIKEAVQQKGAQILAEAGVPVDPNNLQFSNFNISASGDVNADITTRFTRSYDAQSSVGAADAADAAGAVEGEGVPMEEQLQDVQAGPTPSGGEVVEADPETETPTQVLTAAAYAVKMQRRARILERFGVRVAQVGMPPMGGGGAMGGAMGGGMGAAPMGSDPAAGGTNAAGGEAGLSALTGGGDPMGDLAAEGPEGEADTDGLSEKGVKKPWGTVCPVCGHDGLSIGDSNCPECKSKLHFKLSVDAEPQDDAAGDAGEPGAEEDPAAGPELGEDMGLGGATAPAGGAADPMGGGAGAGMAPGGAPGAASGGMMAQAQVEMDAISMLRVAKIVSEHGDAAFDREANLKLPLGMVCLACGDRNCRMIRGKDQSVCPSCNTFHVIGAEDHPTDPTKVLGTVTILA